MNNLGLFSRYLKGRCHGNRFCEKNGKLRIFVALAFRNGIGYHYLNVRINCANDASISCENFVKFGPVISELTLLICERQVQRGQKNLRISSNISGYTGPIFAIFSPYAISMRALIAAIIRLHLT